MTVLATNEELFLVQKEKISVAEDYFGSGGIFSITVYGGLALFVVLMAAGIGWEAYKKNKMKNSGKSGGKEKSRSVVSSGPIQLNHFERHKGEFI